MFEWIKNKLNPEDNEQMIDYFQLEGLMRNQVPFLLFDLRGSAEASLSQKAAQLLKDAEAVTPDQVEVYLKDKQVSEIQPIVLLCIDGKSAKKVARELTKKQWLNVYSVEGGLEQLEKDLKPSF